MRGTAADRGEDAAAAGVRAKEIGESEDGIVEKAIWQAIEKAIWHGTSNDVAAEKLNAPVTIDIRITEGLTVEGIVEGQRDRRNTKYRVITDIIGARHNAGSRALRDYIGLVCVRESKSGGVSAARKGETQ